MSGFVDWLLSDIRVPESAHAKANGAHPWWRVMCLTGVDYFSSLGYAPGIAFLAAGALSPVATLILVLVTLFAALPAYCRVAQASPNGQGSIAMLENLFPRWNGKLFVLVLLGFAITDFIITITLSAADGAAHLVHNPYFPKDLSGQMGITIFILAILGAVFLKGFSEAIDIAVVLVGIYLVLNAVVVVVAFTHILAHPHIVAEWRQNLFQAHGNIWMIIGLAVLVFPRLALGMSGFETGVAVMPLIQAESLEERIRNTRKLLVSAALIMSAFLLATSFSTALLIPAHEFREGGPANGRAVAFLAHHYLGDWFGTAYDFSTIFILGFAGASAMAGLLNLVPRYLPRYGMAPEWARASRPLVFVFFAISLIVTLVFHADVDAQGGAYATGVLVLMTSGAIAVFLSLRKTSRAWVYGPIALVFIYTTATNIYERPEGIKVSSVFIASIICTSVMSRVWRSTELRVAGIDFQPEARAIIEEDHDQIIRLVAHNPGDCSIEAYEDLDRWIRNVHQLSPDENLLFIEARKTDVSDFRAAITVEGCRVGRFCVLRTEGPAVPNALAAILIEIGGMTGIPPHIYFTWPHGHPLALQFRFFFFGDGYTAPMTHEILREAVRQRENRPQVHVV